MSGNVFSYRAGNSALVISIPHDGREIPPEIAAKMTAEGRSIPDTDWHVRRLYAFAEEIDASIIAANYSRYVVDLNRPSTDEALYESQLSTGLCPLKTFDGKRIYEEIDIIDRAETERRIAAYWKPYHAQIETSLADIRSRLGYACLWDAHSIRSTVPSLFAGRLPDLNIGTNDGRSCPARVVRDVGAAAAGLPHTSVVNGRFKGGHITRHYGQPEQGVYAMQLEVAERCYMDESTLRYDARRAAKFAQELKSLVAVYTASATTAAVQAGQESGDSMNNQCGKTGSHTTA